MPVRRFSLINAAIWSLAMPAMKMCPSNPVLGCIRVPLYRSTPLSLAQSAQTSYRSLLTNWNKLPSEPCAVSP